MKTNTFIRLAVWYVASIAVVARPLVSDDIQLVKRGGSDGEGSEGSTLYSESGRPLPKLLPVTSAVINQRIVSLSFQNIRGPEWNHWTVYGELPPQPNVQGTTLVQFDMTYKGIDGGGRPLGVLDEAHVGLLEVNVKQGWQNAVHRDLQHTPSGTPVMINLPVLPAKQLTVATFQHFLQTTLTGSAGSASQGRKIQLCDYDYTEKFYHNPVTGHTEETAGISGCKLWASEVLFQSEHAGFVPPGSFQNAIPTLSTLYNKGVPIPGVMDGGRFVTPKSSPRSTPPRGPSPPGSLGSAPMSISSGSSPEAPACDLPPDTQMSKRFINWLFRRGPGQTKARVPCNPAKKLPGSTVRRPTGGPVGRVGGVRQKGRVAVGSGVSPLSRQRSGSAGTSGAVPGVGPAASRRLSTARSPVVANAGVRSPSSPQAHFVAPGSRAGTAPALAAKP